MHCPLQSVRVWNVLPVHETQKLGLLVIHQPNPERMGYPQLRYHLASAEQFRSTSAFSQLVFLLLLCFGHAWLSAWLWV